MNDDITQSLKVKNIKLYISPTKECKHKGCTMAKEQEKSGRLRNTMFCTATEKVNRKNVNLNDTFLVKRKRVKCLSKNNKGTPSNGMHTRRDNDQTSQSACTTAKEASKRQIKREKAELREAMLKDKSRSEATEKALNYISKWKYDRTNWKFEKLRQVWLVEHLFDEKSVPDAIFSIVLEYFDACKGMVREQLVRKGMDLIKNAENEANDELIKSAPYVRARQLIQVLPMKVCI